MDIIVTVGTPKDSRSSLKILNGKFVIGKEEYSPLAAEMHYFRVAKRYWSICFERIRKAGFRIISTAVPWNLHEARQGEFDFTGRTDPSKDLVVFLELSREFGFKIILKPGPWIRAQWKGGGIPDFVFRHPETAAKDRNGEPLAAKAEAGVSGGLTPSYLHTRFQILLRHYFSVLADVVKNYVYPRGPVFLIEIDSEPSFCHNFDPYSGDYNEYVVRSLMPKFLDTRYETIEKLNSVYKTKFKDFSEITAPTVYDAKTPEEYLRHLDWVAFREHLVNRYADSVAELLSTTEMSAMFSRAFGWNGHYHFPDLADARQAERTIFSTNITLDLPIHQAMDRARSVSAGQELGFVSSFPVGRPAADPDVGEEFRPVTEREVKRLLVATLASGIKGINFNMFVGRDHWYGAALSAEGTIGPSYEVIRHLNFQLARVQFETMRPTASVALLRYRPYLRALNLGRHEPFWYLPDLAGNDFEMIGRGLSTYGYDYRIPELTVPGPLAEYRVLVVPLAEFMSAETQTVLADLLRQGVDMVFYGLLPRLDDRMRPCEILARTLGVRTATETKIYALETNHGKFAARTYGYIRRMPPRAKRLVKSGARTFGIVGKMGGATWHLLTFDPAPAGNPVKGQFFSYLWLEHKVAPVACTSDELVTATLHINDKNGLLYMVEHTPLTPLAEDVAVEARPVVLQLDLAAVGIKARKVKLTEIFSEQSFEISTGELKNGHLVFVKPGDAFMFFIERA